jgi:hypothetical protein
VLGPSFYFLQLKRESKYKAKDEGPAAASGALGLIALSSIEVEKKEIKNRKKKKKNFFKKLG